MTTDLETHVRTKLDEFIEENTWQVVGEVYGAQSPALAEAWVEALTGSRFSMGARTAAEWWASEGLTDRGFERIESTEPGKPGDLVVWSGAYGSAGAAGVGTLGVLLEHAEPDLARLYVFTQGPTPAKTALFDRGGVLGFWRPTTRPIAEPGDVAVFNGDGLVGYIKPPPLPTFKIGDDVTVPRDLVGELVAKMPKLADAVTKPSTWAPPADSPYAKWLVESTTPREPDDVNDWRRAAALFGPSDEEILANYKPAADTTDGAECVKALEEWANKFVGPKLDRRTRLSWAWANLVEAGEQIVEAVKLIAGLWRRNV